MLGGGTFTVQNKVLPGSYINVVSTDVGADVFGERGVTAIGIKLDWGDENIIEMTREDFMKNSVEYFSRPYTDNALKDIREAFKNSSKLLVYKLNQTDQTKATCTYCTAKKYGARGNYIRLYSSKNADNPSLYDVKLTIYDETVFSQTVANIKELNENSYVVWNTASSLGVISGTYLTGGVSGFVEGTDAQNFLNKLDSFTFNAVAMIYDDEDNERLLVEYTKRMRDEVGKKFQCVTGTYSGGYEGNVCVKAKLDNGEDSYHILAWAAGAVGGCAVNKSLTNMLYNGEYTIAADASQTELEQSIKKGEFVFHRVNGDVRVLLDINSLVDTTAEKGEDFKDNQTIRLIDRIAADIASIFNCYYLGRVPNDAAGRNSLWCDIVKHHEKLLELRALDGFDENSITVEKGESRKSVVITDVITPANAMTQLYMTVRIN